MKKLINLLICIIIIILGSLYIKIDAYSDGLNDDYYLHFYSKEIIFNSANYQYGDEITIPYVGNALSVRSSDTSVAEVSLEEYQCVKLYPKKPGKLIVSILGSDESDMIVVKLVSDFAITNVTNNKMVLSKGKYYYFNYNNEYNSDNFELTSSNKKVVSVDNSDGSMYATGEGKAIVSVRDVFNKTVNVEITVNAKLDLDSSKTKYSIYTGETLNIFVSEASTMIKKYSLSKKGVVNAKIYSGGEELRIKGKKKGKTIVTIYDKYKNKKKITITVKEKVYKLNKTSVSIIHGGTYQLYVKDYNGKVKWTSSNDQIASVNKSGDITGENVGTCTITAKLSNGKICKCSVNVTFNCYTDVQNLYDYSPNNFKYGQVSFKLHRMFYSDGNLVVELYAYNNRIYRAEYFDWIYIEFNKIGVKHRFENVPIDLEPGGSKMMTFVIPNQKPKYNLSKEKPSLKYNYWYHYSY